MSSSSTAAPRNAPSRIRRPADCTSLHPLHFSPVVEDRHLHVGVGLQTVVEGAQVRDSGAECKPLPVQAHSHHVQKRRREQKLLRRHHDLIGVVCGKQLKDAAEAHRSLTCRAAGWRNKQVAIGTGSLEHSSEQGRSRYIL